MKKKRSRYHPGVLKKFAKMLRFLKLTILFMMLGGMPVLAGSFLQQTNISLKMREVTVRNAIDAIEKVSGYDFFFSEEEVNLEKVISFSFSKSSLEEVVAKIFGADFKYRIVKNIVVISPKTNKENNGKQRKKTIKGKVVDRNGNPLAGVSVVVKGTTIGMPTDMNGNFSFDLFTDSAVVLSFSFIGMKNKEMIYKEQKDMEIVLEEDVEEIEEIVVTGYQSINRKDMVGSATTIKAVDVMKAAYASIDQMLQGHVAGMIVQNTSSRVGTSPTIRIRGTSTILGNRDPLWVVDGIIQPTPIPMDASTFMTDDLKNIIGNQISWLNPSDIETITVLKDASATAIYGSKASNGVIVISTKKGKPGKTKVNYTSTYSLRRRPSYDMFNFMNSQERIQFGIEAYDAGVNYNRLPDKQIHTYEGLMRMYLDNEIGEDYFKQELSKLETANTNWFNLVTRNSMSTNQNLSLSGGTSKLRYNASVSYNNSKGIEIGNNSERMSARIRINADLNAKLKFSFSLSGTTGANDGYAPGVNPMGYATQTSRAIRAFDDNGDRLFYQQKAKYALNSNVASLGFNILNEIENSYSKTEFARISASANLNWKINSCFTYQLVMGYIKNNSDSEAYCGENTFQIAQKYRGYGFGSVTPSSKEYKAAMLPYGGELFTSNRKNSSYNIQNKLLFSKTFHETHRVNVMLGTEINSTDNLNLSNTVWGYVPERGEKIMRPTPINELVPIGASVGDDLGIFGELYRGRWKHTTQKNNFVSLFATAAYSIKNKYVFNANLRSDASNRFGQDVNDRFEPIWSAGFSWRMAQEDFIKNNIPWLNQAKWRVTYGTQGNVVTSKSPDLIAIQQGVASVYNQYTASISSLPNPYLKWEKTKSWNFGLDLQLFRVLSMNIEYYQRSSNAIVSQQIAQEYGKAMMDLNGGLLTNYGIEYTLNITPVKTQNFAWTIGVNSSKNWNKSNNAPLKAVLGDYINGSSQRLKEGYAISSFWSYSYARLDQNTGYPTFHLLNKEENKDIDPTDFLVYSGKKEPDFTGGVNTRIRYKGLSVGANFSVLLGKKTRLPNPYSNFASNKLPESYYNLDRNLINRWKKPGDEKFTDIPALFTDVTYYVKLPNGESHSFYDMWANSDNRVVDASFLRCQQISLSWNIDSKLYSKHGISNIAFTANVNNAFVIANKKFEGFDPELGNSIMPRTYSLGLNVSF